MSLLSIVIPSYNEERMIPKTVSVVGSLMKNENIDCELIFVDDGSRDKTFAKICEAAKSDARVHGIHFSRNFGKEAAIFAGIAESKGDCVAVMDCDLQHPPETLVEMYREWEKGAEVVEGIKRSRGKESGIHAAFAGLFYSLLSKAMNLDMSRESDFKLLDRRAVEALMELPEKQTFFRAMSSWVGFEVTTVEFDVREREEGETKWSTKALFKYAISNLVGYSDVPMQLVTGAGVLFFLFAVALSIQTLFKYMSGSAVEGFTTVILLVLFIGSILMISLGIIGYYIARIYNEVKCRPRYIISRKI